MRINTLFVFYTSLLCVWTLSGTGALAAGVLKTDEPAGDDVEPDDDQIISNPEHEEESVPDGSGSFDEDAKQPSEYAADDAPEQEQPTTEEEDITEYFCPLEYIPYNDTPTIEEVPTEIPSELVLEVESIQPAEEQVEDNGDGVEKFEDKKEDDGSDFTTINDGGEKFQTASVDEVSGTSNEDNANHEASAYSEPGVKDESQGEVVFIKVEADPQEEYSTRDNSEDTENKTQEETKENLNKTQEERQEDNGENRENLGIHESTKDVKNENHVSDDNVEDKKHVDDSSTSPSEEEHVEATTDHTNLRGSRKLQQPNYAGPFSSYRYTPRWIDCNVITNLFGSNTACISPALAMSNNIDLGRDISDSTGFPAEKFLGTIAFDEREYLGRIAAGSYPKLALF